MKKKFVVIFVLIITILFTACSEKDDNKDDVTNIEFWHAMGGPLGDALATMVTEFNETHPDIHVNAISMGRYEALSQKLMAAIVSKTQPDLAQAHENWTAKLIDGDAIVPIEKFIKGKNGLSQEELNDFYPVFLKSSTFRDTIWAFPFNKSVRVMYYNKDMFYRNDLDINNPPRTWQEFIDVCQVLTKDNDNDGTNDIWGTTFATSVWQFLNLLHQAGGKVINAAHTKPLLNSKYGLEALNFLNNLLNEYKIAYLSTGYDGQNDFLASKVGIVEGSSVSMVYMQRHGNIPFNIGIAPVLKRKTKQSLISGTNVVVFKDEREENNIEKQKACWEFIKWFTSTEVTAEWSDLTYYMPVRRSAVESERLQSKFEVYPGLQNVYAQLEYAVVPPQLAAWFETRKYIQEHVLEKVFRDRLTPKQALDKAAEHLKEKLIEEE